MLLENIFAASLLIFILMIAVVSFVSHFNLWPHRRYDKAIMIVFMLSGLVTIITAIWWIVRAWG